MTLAEKLALSLVVLVVLAAIIVGAGVALGEATHRLINRLHRNADG